MPFPPQTRKVFAESVVIGLEPNQMGVYGIFRPGEWIYIGSGDIRARLLDHLHGDNPCITRELPSHWIDVVTIDYEQREKDLIFELNPLCNQRSG